MHIFDLNGDVLAAIISYVDKESLVQVMATCRNAHDLAISHLLSSVDLRRHIKQVHDFCQYILSPSHSARQLPLLLRSLSLSDGAKILETDPPFQTTLDFNSLLVEVLEKSHNLRILHIENIDLIIKYDPRIGEAIVRLPALTTVIFTGARSRCFAMISRMRGLRHIHVEHIDDLIPVIRPFQATLETVHSEYKHWRNFADLQSLTDTDQWPHVRSLKLGVVNIRPHRLVRAFPNLRSLCLQGGVPSAKDPCEKEQMQCWSRLDYVEGLVVELYQLALTCPIRELRFNSPPESLLRTKSTESEGRSFGPPEMFLDLVRTVSPVALSFPVSANMQDEAFFQKLAALLPSLKVLGLLMDFQPLSTLSHLRRITNCLINVPIVYFTLELSRSTPARVDPEELPMYFRPVMSIPTVEFIELQLRGNPKHPAFGTRMRSQTSWWRVTPGSDGDRNYERISGDLGRQMRGILLADQF